MIENGVNYSVKDNRKVKRIEVRGMLMTYCCDEVVVKRRKCSFGAVMFDIGRLSRVIEEI